MPEPPRYLPNRPFPPYTYVPGQAPHPIRDPAGHMYGQEPEPPELLVDEWWNCEEYLWGIDLFNHGYYWEAHEAWEGLWHAAGRRGPVANFLKGLIKLAAAGVKTLEGSTVGRLRHLRRAIELFDDVRATIHAGRSEKEIQEIIDVAHDAIESDKQPDAEGSKSIGTLPIILRPLQPESGIAFVARSEASDSGSAEQS